MSKIKVNLRIAPLTCAPAPALPRVHMRNLDIKIKRGGKQQWVGAGIRCAPPTDDKPVVNRGDNKQQHQQQQRQVCLNVCQVNVTSSSARSPVSGDRNAWFVKQQHLGLPEPVWTCFTDKQRC